MEEREIVTRRAARGTEEVALTARITREELLASQGTIKQVHVHESVVGYIVDLVSATRAHASVQIGASPRGTLSLLKLARARAALHRRDYATPDDVKDVAVAALAHRILLRPELWIQHVDAADVIRDCLSNVPVPPAQPEPGANGTSRTDSRAAGRT